MADETFRPRRQPIKNEELDDEAEMKQIEQMRATLAKQAAADDEEVGAIEQRDEPPPPQFARDNDAIEIKGNPQAFFEAMQAKKKMSAQPFQNPVQNAKESIRAAKAAAKGAEVNAQFLKVLELVDGLHHNYDPIQIPSKGVFYDGSDGPTDGNLDLRAMTGQEEEILATPKYVKQGMAMNMIFQRCLQQSQFRPENLLTADRTYLLIWLRCISYSPEYDVEIKCPECDGKFNHTIDLSKLDVEYCPDDFGQHSLTGKLPKTGLNFRYRLSRGRDEQELQEYRERKLKMWGDQQGDDTLLYRTTMLIEDLEGITDKNEIQTLMKRLPIQDVAFLRNLINDPPFGVDTNCPIMCARCMHEFEIDLPLEAGFFFPRRKKHGKKQA
jgi:hypothetical protein